MGSEIFKYLALCVAGINRQGIEWQKGMEDGDGSSSFLPVHLLPSMLCLALAHLTSDTQAINATPIESDNLSLNKSLIALIISCVLIRFPPCGAHHVCDSVSAAVQMLSNSPFTDTVEEIFVLGGTEVYRVKYIVCFTFS